jgi:hypothetical protein
LLDDGSIYKNKLLDRGGNFPATINVRTILIAAGSRSHTARLIKDNLKQSTSLKKKDLSFRLSAISHELSAISHELSAISHELSAISYQL